MSFNHLGGLLFSRLGKKNLAYRVEAAMVLEYFNQVVVGLWGDRLKQNFKPLYVRDQVLTVAVLSPVMASELKLRESSIMEAINKKIGREAVRSLRFLS